MSSDKAKQAFSIAIYSKALKTLPPAFLRCSLFWKGWMDGCKSTWNCRFMLREGNCFRLSSWHGGQWLRRVVVQCGIGACWIYGSDALVVGNFGRSIYIETAPVQDCTPFVAILFVFTICLCGGHRSNTCPIRCIAVCYQTELFQSISEIFGSEIWLGHFIWPGD